MPGRQAKHTYLTGRADLATGKAERQVIQDDMPAAAHDETTACDDGLLSGGWPGSGGGPRDSHGPIQPYSRGRKPGTDVITQTAHGAAGAGGLLVTGAPHAGGGGPDRGLGGGRRQRRGVDEGASGGAGLHCLVRRAPGQELPPGQEPVGPAVVPLASLRAGGDGDRVAGHREIVVRLGTGGREVHAPVADVDGALHAR